MNTNIIPPKPLSLKPGLVEADRRWQANRVGEIIDRPLVWLTAPLPGRTAPPRPDYRALVHDDIDQLCDRILAGAEATWWGGESIPGFFLSFGPDEMAVFCGGALAWSEDSGNTNWSVPFIQDWATDLPLSLKLDNPLLQRLLEFYRRASARFAGKMLLTPPDLHSNMDLLAAVRGSQPLCLDLLDCPELIDRAMADTLTIFREYWKLVTEAGRMYELGFTHAAYSMTGTASLQCDFCCMMSPPMFRRWVMPVLEAEAEIVGWATYHWDGPGALVHADSLFASRGLQALSYVTGAGHGSHVDCLPLLQRIQAGGKCAHVGGTPDEIKFMHRHLRPDRVVYFTHAATPDEGEALLEWLRKNT